MLVKRILEVLSEEGVRAVPKNIRSEVLNGVGLITLDRPESLNSLTTEMVEELEAILSTWQTDLNVACVFLAGAGEKGFCAGGDVRRMREAILSGEKDSRGLPVECIDFFSKEYRVDYLIHRYEKPIVVWGDGIVMGGGIGLIAGASHRVLTERARLAMPEITIGLFPDVGATWFLNRMPPGWGLYLALTGARFAAADALYLGLADHYLPSTGKDELLKKLLSADWGSDSPHNTVTTILEGLSIEPPHSNVKERQAIVAQSASVESVAEFRRYFENVAKDDEWFQAGLKTFRAGSPTSAAIIFEQLKRGAQFSLEAAFQSELNLAAQCSLHPDFPEGVRALLVDKDQRPNWQPAHESEVTNGWVNGHFVPLWTESEHPLRSLGKRG